MVMHDDMKTPQEIVEGTAVIFANSWKSSTMCEDKEERHEDPCSLSVDNGKRVVIVLFFFTCQTCFLDLNTFLCASHMLN